MSTLLQQLKAQQRRERNGGSKKKRKKKATKKRKKKARKKTSKKRVRRMTPRASNARVAKLRAAGYKVSRVMMPDGTIVVLRSKKAKKAAKKRKKRGEAVGAYSFGALMRRGGKRKLNVERTRSRIRNLYKQGELAQANKLRAKLKAAGYDYK